MQQLFALSLSTRLAFVFLGGLMLGALANWAVYRLAWNRREISPWGPIPKGAPTRKAHDRIPFFGWLALRREHTIHGQGFWLRPMLIELAMASGLALLYWWEVDQQGLIVGQVVQLLQNAGDVAVKAPLVSNELTHAVFLSHVVLITLMVAASFIDIDEKTIPDWITVPGTLFGLILATLLPMSLLPHVDVREASSVVAEQIVLPDVQAVPIFVEPMTLAAPNLWPTALIGTPNWKSLAIAQACWWLWCFALTPRFWRGRHGACRALNLILRRVIRELLRPPLAAIAWTGCIAIAAVWWWGEAAWIGLLTALAGMVVSGGMVWVVRIVGTAALHREAMGFGDVTLMMMVGTFLGWQAGVMIFFVAPFAGLVVGLLQLLLRRDDEIPYGPFLCLGALVVAVRWSDFWTPNIQGVFGFVWLISIVLIVSFALLGIVLAIWQTIKNRLLGNQEEL